MKPSTSSGSTSINFSATRPCASRWTRLRPPRGRFNQAEQLAATLVEPIFQIFDIVTVLDFHVGDVRLRDVFGIGPLTSVNVHVQRHICTPLYCWANSAKSVKIVCALHYYSPRWRTSGDAITGWQSLSEAASSRHNSSLKRKTQMRAFLFPGRAASRSAWARRWPRRAGRARHVRGGGRGAGPEACSG